MFKLLRSKAKVFYWVIAASFVLFIFLAWGMNFTGGRSGRTTSDPRLVGEVGGLPISAYEWDNAYQDYLTRLRQQNPDNELDANQRARAMDEIWGALVDRKLEDLAIQKYKLVATPDEILRTLKENPPRELIAQYLDEEGKPDLEAYYADLANPQRDWTRVEAYLRDLLPRQKLQKMIAAGAVVSEPEIREAYRDQNAQVVAEYIGVPYDELTVEEPDSAALVAYYESHTSDYWRPKRLALSAVRWQKLPSELDRQEVLSLARDVRGEIVSGQLDFAEAARIYSQDATADKGGDLGTFGRDRMVAAFSEAAFSLPVGEISQPVETPFGFHLIEVLQRIPEGSEGEAIEQVHARHILFKIEPGSETLTDLYTAAEDFRARALDVGFAKAASEDSLEVLSPEPVVAMRDLPGLRRSIEATIWADQAKKDAISPILENQSTYYIVTLRDRVPAGPAPFAEVQAQVRLDLNKELQKELAEKKLAPAVGEVQMGKEMAEVAEERGLEYAVTDTVTASSRLPDLGQAPVFISAALQAPVGTIVPELALRQGLYAVRPIWQSPFDEEDYQAKRDQILSGLLGLKQRQLIQDWYAQQRDETVIHDQRFARRVGEG
jgi:parvulin-like peptidyl-prolyl isomerase